MHAELLPIDRDIPPPGTRTAPEPSPRRQAIDTLKSLQIGESVFVPGKRARDLSSWLMAAKAGTEKYFQSKTMTTGARVWRLE